MPLVVRESRQAAGTRGWALARRALGLPASAEKGLPPMNSMRLQSGCNVSAGSDHPGWHCRRSSQTQSGRWRRSGERKPAPGSVRVARRANPSRLGSAAQAPTAGARREGSCLLRARSWMLPRRSCTWCGQRCGRRSRRLRLPKPSAARRCRRCRRCRRACADPIRIIPHSNYTHPYAHVEITEGRSGRWHAGGAAVGEPACRIRSLCLIVP